MTNKNIVTLEFANQNIPQPIETKNTSDNTFVHWGLNNLYPNFLIDLYNQSAIHSSIINQKTTYIIGTGVVDKNNKPIEAKVNSSDNLVEFTSKIIKDYLLFNAYAIEVIKNVFGEIIQLHHIPVHKLRMNKSKTKFWFCEDWIYSRKYITYERYNPNVQGTESTIYYYDGFFPSINNVYSTPEYNGCRNAILTDVAIQEFNLNNIKNHFSPSSIITFFNGKNISEAVKKATSDEIEKHYKGTNGKKIMLDFQDKDGQGAKVESLTAGDWDKQYQQVNEQNISSIMIGHSVINPSLFGIKTQGQLGNTQELEVSYEMFKNNYVSVKRNELTTSLNYLFNQFKGINTSIAFGDRPLFYTQLKDDVKLKIYTINELRKDAGLPPLANGDRLIDEAATPATDTPINQEQVQDDVKKNSKKLSEQDYELIAHLGNAFEDFDLIEEVKHLTHQFDKESDVAKYVIDNDIKGLTIKELVDLLNKDGIKTDNNELNDILKNLNDSGVIKVNVGSNDRIEISPSKKPNIADTDSVSVMYQYIKKPEVKGDDLLPTSRSFCVKLIENNRLYTRDEIQEMSAIFGYDIYKFSGGWYFDPETQSTSSSCRHTWKMWKVKRKSN